MSISPSTKNCSLYTSTNICEGCGRTLDEIVEWTRMTDDGKQQMMIRLSRKPEIKMWEGENLY